MAAAQTKLNHTQDARNEAYAALAGAHGLLPIKVTPFYQKKVDAEVARLGHYGGPLARTVYPSEDRLQLRAPGEVADWWMTAAICWLKPKIFLFKNMKTEFCLRPHQPARRIVCIASVKMF